MHNDAKNFLFSNEVIQVSRIVSELIGIKKKVCYYILSHKLFGFVLLKPCVVCRVRIQFDAALLCAVIA